jgi:MFS family permease
MTIVPSFGALLLVYCLLQASSNTAQGPYQGMLPDQVPDEQRGRASGLYGGLQMVALLLASVLIGLVLIPSGHLSLAILSIAGVLAVTGAMVVFGVSDVRTTGPAGGSLARSILLSFVVDVRRYPDFAWLMVSRLLFLISIAGVERFALYFIQDTFHLTSSDASKDTSYLLLAIVLVAALVSTTAGFLSERWGRKRLVAAACLVGAIGVALMITAHSLAAILLFGIVLGVATGIFLSVDWAFATDLIPKAEAGRYMGISNIATAGSGILAGIVFGPIIDFFNHAGGTAGTLGYQVMFGIAAAFYLIAMLTLRPVREIKVS